MSPYVRKSLWCISGGILLLWTWLMLRLKINWNSPYDIEHFLEGTISSGTMGISIVVCLSTALVLFDRVHLGKTCLRWAVPWYLLAAALSIIIPALAMWTSARMTKTDLQRLDAPPKITLFSGETGMIIFVAPIIIFWFAVAVFGIFLVAVAVQRIIASKQLKPLPNDNG